MKSIRLFFVVLILFGFLGPLSTRAQQSTSAIEAQRAQLQADLEAEERAIAEQTKLLLQKQRETATVQGDIDLLKSQIKQAQTDIKAKKVQISRLDSDIAERNGKISALDAKIKREQASLAELLRKSRDSNTDSLPEIVLGNNRLSDFFNRLEEIDQVQIALHDSFAELRNAENAAHEEKAALEQQKNKTIDAQKLIETQQQVIQKRESEKNVLLKINKGQEAAYQSVLAERQKKAAQIRAALFGLRDSAAIQFGKALEYATAASLKTGVRPAFILAILKQESNLGQNVGSCLLTDLTTGNGVGKNTGTVFEKVMKPPRDTVPFVDITSRLGMDWKSTPVSCPIGSTKYYVGRGFGGAMGPAQFIPSTWQGLESTIAAAVGKANPDPWNASDAFMASALFLRDLGASGGGYSAEVRAACKYYGTGGASCTYGNQVMAKASDIQINMIDPLQNT